MDVFHFWHQITSDNWPNGSKWHDLKKGMYTMELASGKRLHNYIKSPFLLMGKSSINGVFSIAMLNYQRVTSNNIIQHQIFLLEFTSTWDIMDVFSFWTCSDQRVESCLGITFGWCREWPDPDCWRTCWGDMVPPKSSSESVGGIQNQLPSGKLT